MADRDSHEDFVGSVPRSRVGLGCSLVPRSRVGLGCSSVPRSRVGLRCLLVFCLFGWVMVCPLAVTPVSADTVHLNSGGQLEGTVTRFDQAKVPYAVVTLEPGIKIAIVAHQIGRVVGESALDEYRQKAAEASADAEQQYELARWCRQQNLRAQSRYHLHRTIQSDPDHSAARTALGYTYHEGQWVRLARLQQSRGLVRVGNSYRLPAALMLEEAKSDERFQTRQWQLELSRLQKTMARGGDRAAEAREQLLAIRDPLAAKAFADELANQRQPREMRLFWISRLASLDGSAAIDALVMTGLKDSDAVIREQALEAVSHRAPQAAIARLVPLLKSSDNGQVRAAAEALAYFPTPELVPPLVDALVTKHKQQIGGGGGDGIAAGFSPTGGGGFSTGGKVQIKEVPIENPPVLKLLRELEPSVDFGFNQLGWRQYLASRYSSAAGHLRRDP